MALMLPESLIWFQRYIQYTETNYFKFFKKRIRNKFSAIVIETETVGSNARAVFNFAENFLQNDQNISKYAAYDKYLVFDCDAPDDILDVIKDAKSSANNYQLLISSLLFECWLLMHLETLPGAPLSKTAIGEKTYSLSWFRWLWKAQKWWRINRQNN